MFRDAHVISILSLSWNGSVVSVQRWLVVVSFVPTVTALGVSRAPQVGRSAVPGACGEPTAVCLRECGRLAPL